MLLPLGHLTIINGSCCQQSERTFYFTEVYPSCFLYTNLTDFLRRQRTMHISGTSQLHDATITRKKTSYWYCWMCPSAKRNEGQQRHIWSYFLWTWKVWRIICVIVIVHKQTWGEWEMQRVRMSEISLTSTPNQIKSNLFPKCNTASYRIACSDKLWSIMGSTARHNMH